MIFVENGRALLCYTCSHVGPLRTYNVHFSAPPGATAIASSTWVWRAHTHTHTHTRHTQSRVVSARVSACVLKPSFKRSLFCTGCHNRGAESVANAASHAFCSCNFRSPTGRFSNSSLCSSRIAARSSWLAPARHQCQGWRKRGGKGAIAPPIFSAMGLAPPK